MTSEMTKVFAYVTALLILVGTYYALVLYPYALDSDVKLWLTGAAGGALTFVFGDQVASRTARNTLNASDSGAAKAMSTPTITTTTSGPPASTTTVGPAPQNGGAPTTPPPLADEGDLEQAEPTVGQG